MVFVPRFPITYVVLLPKITGSIFDSLSWEGVHLVCGVAVRQRLTPHSIGNIFFRDESHQTYCFTWVAMRKGLSTIPSNRPSPDRQSVSTESSQWIYRCTRGMQSGQAAMDSGRNYMREAAVLHQLLFQVHTERIGFLRQWAVWNTHRMSMGYHDVMEYLLTNDNNL